MFESCLADVEMLPPPIVEFKMFAPTLLLIVFTRTLAKVFAPIPARPPEARPFKMSISDSAVRVVDLAIVKVVSSIIALISLSKIFVIVYPPTLAPVTAAEAPTTPALTLAFVFAKRLVSALLMELSSIFASVFPVNWFTFGITLTPAPVFTADKAAKILFI